MESTLSLKRSHFVEQLGFHLGWGCGEDQGDRAWTTAEERELNFCVDSGIRQFYYPPCLPGTQTSYNWSFLQPFASLTLASGSAVLDLPDDFGGLEGDITVTASEGLQPWPVSLYNEGRIVEAYSLLSDATGTPMMAALKVSKDTTAIRGSRMQLWFYPEADQSFTIQFPYYFIPDALSGAWPYPHGGAEHSETILESCLAIAEQRLDDNVQLHTMKFLERLMVSVSIDRRKKPQTLGYNRDRSDGVFWDRRSNYQNIVTVNGITPT